MQPQKGLLHRLCSREKCLILMLEATKRVHDSLYYIEDERGP